MYALAHPSPILGMCRASLMRNAQSREKATTGRENPPAREEIFFLADPLSPPKSKGDELLPSTLETILVRAHIVKRDDVALAEVHRISFIAVHPRACRRFEEQLTQSIPRRSQSSLNPRPMFLNARAVKSNPNRLGKRKRKRRGHG